jgi:hypothetical protein
VSEARSVIDPGGVRAACSAPAAGVIPGERVGLGEVGARGRPIVLLAEVEYVGVRTATLAVLANSGLDTRLPAGGCDCGAVAAAAERVVVGEGGTGAAGTAAGALRGETGEVTEPRAAAAFCAEELPTADNVEAAGTAALVALRLSKAAFNNREVSSRLAALGCGSSRSMRVSNCSMRTQMRTPPKVE